MNIENLNQQQKEAVLYNEGPLLILAGAGSGKTKVLTTKIAYLIEELWVSPYEILAITFTNKAAHEMKDRVYQLIGQEANAIQISIIHEKKLSEKQKQLFHRKLLLIFTSLMCSDNFVLLEVYNKNN